MRCKHIAKTVHLVTKCSLTFRLFFQFLDFFFLNNLSFHPCIKVQRSPSTFRLGLLQTSYVASHPLCQANILDTSQSCKFHIHSQVTEKKKKSLFETVPDLSPTLRKAQLASHTSTCKMTIPSERNPCEHTRVCNGYPSLCKL